MNDGTLLHRQINPSFVQGDRVTSAAFKPTPKDDRLLSVYDGDQIEAEDAYAHFRENPKCSSCGTLAVTVSECQSKDLPARPDPAPFPEHAVVDFSEHSNSQIEKKSKLLRNDAIKRGWTYQPE